MKAITFTVAWLLSCGGSSNLCDSAQSSQTCTYSNGQCVRFTGLSTADLHSVRQFCTSNSATQSDSACPTANRLGTCTIPPTGPGTGVTCSPQATIVISYFAPYTAS